MEKMYNYTLFVKCLFLITIILLDQNGCFVQAAKHFTKERKLQLREEVRAMFQHAYEGYLRYASDYDELRPLTCDGIDTWGSYSLTLIDALDTLATMGNYTEFRRVVELLQKKINFDKDINVSVFETNIRIVGGLLSAHLLSKKAGISLEQGWPCQGPLLRMAENVAKRLLPAFDTATGMPYGTVNLKYGVPKDETPITCTAGVGTLLIEFGTLSRLTGDPVYEKVALNALYGLWQRRSSIGLFGNHIDVQSGKWTALDSGIGAGVDSFFEYLVKGAILLQRPELLEMFHEARHAIDKYLRHDDWYVWVGMNKGHITLPVFQSLEAFWPGLLSMIGDISSASKTFANYASVWHKYGFLPEFYNIPNGEASPHRESYPLRPELVESALYLYRATKNEFMLEIGEHMLKSIEHSAKTKCGYATIRNVVSHEKENRMESFFLAETTKYLYILFDEDNFLHSSAEGGDIVIGPYGECAINSGPYIFNTEAHPIDLSSLYCCHDLRQDIFENFDLQQFSEVSILRQEQEWVEKKPVHFNQCKDKTSRKNAGKQKSPQQQHQQQEYGIAIDIEVFDEDNEQAADILIRNFEKIKNEKMHHNSANASNNFADNSVTSKTQLTIIKITSIFEVKRRLKSANITVRFLQKILKDIRLEPALISAWHIFDKNFSLILGAVVQTEFENTTSSMWRLYSLRQQYAVNVQLLINLNLQHLNEDDLDDIKQTLAILNGDESSKEVSVYIKETIHNLYLRYSRLLVNTTAIQEFMLRIITNNHLTKSEEEPLNLPVLLTEEEILSFPIANMSEQQQRDLFAPAKRVLELKKRMIETFQKLQVLIVESNKKQKAHNELMQRADIDNLNETPETETGSSQLMEGENDRGDNNKILNNLPGNISAEKDDGSTLLGDNITDDSNNQSETVWSQFVRTILRKTLPKQTKFNVKKLLEKTQHSLQQYKKFKANFNLFQCENQKFFDRFAYRYFYP